MTRQADYGDANDKTLVPGSLRVFRHFGVDLANGLVTPMNYRPEAMYHVTSPHTPPPVYGRGFQRTYEARCTRQASPSFYDYNPPGRHPSPEVTCSCGFYAHYKQSEDFYGHVNWGREWYEAAMQPMMGNMVVIRAVCEVSGTTVMGRRGVRAQKMQIAAAAVDWSKYRHPNRRIEEEPFKWRSIPNRDHLYDFGDYYSQRRILSQHEPTAQERDRVDEHAYQILTERYGVPFFRDWTKMYEQHPEADISALGIEERPTEEIPYSAHRLFTTLQQDIQRQAAAYARAADVAADLAKQMHALFGVDTSVSTGTPTPKQRKPKRPKVRKGDPKFVAALEAKRNRQAPPGTGIDRRRGRLR